MLRKLGFVALAISLVVPVWSAEKPATISGYVRNAGGIPQMGVAVEFLSSAAQSLTVFTDENGFYSAADLIPGIYSVRASAMSFLPTLREGVGLKPGGRISLNLTLNTLFDALKTAGPSAPSQEDDWKWVLRSASNRPILRFDDKSSPFAVEQQGDNHDLKGAVSFVAGSSNAGFGSSSDMNTNFSLERSLFSSNTIGLQGDIGYGVATPASVVRASFSHKMPDGSEPQLALIMRNLPVPYLGLQSNALQAFGLTTSDTFSLGDIVELHFGSDFETIQFLGRATAFRPFGSAAVHLSPNTVLRYSYSSAEPTDLLDRGFDSAPADLSESQPRVTMVNYNSMVEHAHHHEISVAHHMGKTSVQLAAYYDRVLDPALTGVGELSTDQGMVLPDIYSGTFTYQGNDLKTEGARMVVEQKLPGKITAAVDIDSGGVLDLESSNATLANAQQWIGTRNRQSVAGKVSGVTPKTKTRWVASYRWIDGPALTPVDIFNESAGRADPYLNIFIRQPLPSFFPGHMEAIVDLRNLLAEGYVPVIGSDGRTVYLVQSARSIRGGLNFTF
ncbi:MAG TPA: carboxypeptidase-like regulatory domain-containing protein [Terriglobales bacterium]|nr:carboxypeptidase-like regulatory domain-containing protein [Terriglobales bacterium]